TCVNTSTELAEASIEKCPWSLVLVAVAVPLTVTVTSLTGCSPDLTVPEICEKIGQLIKPRKTKQSSLSAKLRLIAGMPRRVDLLIIARQLFILLLVII